MNSLAIEMTPEESRTALEVLRSKRVAVFIVAYNAEKYLESVIDRIPRDILPLLAEILVIDDSSTDTTYDVATKIQNAHSHLPLHVYRTPNNRGYGGNQKLGYLYCVKQKYDFVILLHGDGQYAPEYLPRIIATFSSEPDAVFGSRMLIKSMALKGGMPLYKWIGNSILTAFENSLLGTQLSEFHTGFRAYRIESLSKIPFVFNTDDFHFDTEIIIQAVAMGWRIQEVPIPTHYGDEICHVNGISYAWNCMKAVLRYKLVHLGLLYQRNFDFGLFEEAEYDLKKSPRSLHQFVINNPDLQKQTTSIELGAGKGLVSSHIAPKVRRHVSVDLKTPQLAGLSEALSLNLNTEFSETLPKKSFDCCVCLDVIEHLDDPEKFLNEVFQIMRTNGKLYISTANICYLPVRISLLLGQFNYGKRGILDRTHKRLFSVNSFQKLLSQYGFKIEFVRGFPPPLTDFVSQSKLMIPIEVLHAWLSRTFPSMFAYNFVIVAHRLDGISEIFDLTVRRKIEEKQAMEV